MNSPRIKIPVAQRNYNAKPPKIGGGMGIKPPKKISQALGTSVNTPVHKGSVQQLLSHPDKSIAKAAQKLMRKF